MCQGYASLLSANFVLLSNPSSFNLGQSLTHTHTPIYTPTSTSNYLPLDLCGSYTSAHLYLNPWS